MTEEVKHYQVNGKYRVVFERSAVKDRDGFKVEANDDDADNALEIATILYNQATLTTKPTEG